jgi:hypothetical protein
MLGSINFMVTVMNLRAPGVRYSLLNLYVWSIIITAILLILALPVLAGKFILPALNLALCWEDLFLGLSAGNLHHLNFVGILRDSTPKLIFYKNHLSSYLAGLIEGDGTIFVPKKERNEKNQLNYPSIQIVFNLKDLPLALILQKVLSCGSIQKKKGVNAYIFSINNLKGIILVTNLINGYMRTSKINKFYLLIDWLNQYHHLNIIKKDKDISSLDSNAWLSGLIDADGQFSIRTTLESKKIECKFELSQKTMDILNNIASFLLTTVKVHRTNYRIRTTSLKGNLNLVNYLMDFPLFSSKYLDYLDWLKVLNYFKEKKSKDLKEIIKIKNQMNDKRTFFYWDHLNNFYKLNKEDRVPSDN